MKYYKLVKVIGERYYSLLITGKYRVEYRVGSFVSASAEMKSEGYHLFLFNSIEHATHIKNKYYEHSFDVIVFECIVDDVVSVLPKKLDFEALREEEFVKTDSKWPTYTVMAEQVKLIKEF